MFKHLFWLPAWVSALFALSVLFTPSAAAQDKGAVNNGGAVDIVAVTGGEVQGVPTDVEGVQVFKGIPFAGPNGGEMRWQPPQPVVPWEGVLVADTWGDQAMQPTDLNPPGTFWGDEFYYDPEYLPPASENGLFLNVWTPANSSADNLPVYVYIHGGGNNHGFASEMEFVASKLAAKGIIVVTVSYRVGPFGFMAHPELSAESPQGVSGNYATLDLIQALQWVQDNIAGFGGDPTAVTIGGQSAGAMNSAALLSSPLAKGLFQRVVLHSGFSGFFPNALSPYVPLEEREAAAVDAIATVFGKDLTIEELRAIPGEEFITGKTADGESTIFWGLNGAVTGYTLDDYVFTEQSIDLLAPGALDGYDIMLGGTSNEFSSLVGAPDATMTLDEFNAAMEKLGYPADQTAYQPDSELEANRLWLTARADQTFQNYLLSAELAQKSNEQAHIYTYLFDHEPPGRDADYYGAWHSSDLWYWFDSMRDDVAGQRNWTSADHRMADLMTSYLVNFVKTGDPNGEGLPAWNETTADTHDFMRFADGYAYPVTETPYPDRDALNQAAIMAAQGMTETAALPAKLEFVASLYGFPYPIALAEDASSAVTAYTATVHTSLTDFTYTPVLADESNSLEIDGKPATSGQAYTVSIPAETATVVIPITVTTPAGDSKAATLTIDKRDLAAEYAASEIGDGVYRILDYGGAPGTESMYLVLGEQKALLIDLGIPAAGDLIGYVQTLTDLPVEVAILHGHGDHIGQIQQVLDLGLPVYMSEQDQFMLESTDMSPVAVTNFENFVWVSEGDVIDLGGRELQVIDVPGHTPGSLVLLDAANKLLFTSDTLGSGMGVWAQLDSSLPLDQIVESYAHLESITSEYDELRILPGHDWQMSVPLEGEAGVQFVSDMRATAEKIVNGELVGEEVSYSPGALIASFGLGAIVYNPENITSAE